MNVNSEDSPEIYSQMKQHIKPGFFLGRWLQIWHQRPLPGYLVHRNLDIDWHPREFSCNIRANQPKIVSGFFLSRTARIWYRQIFSEYLVHLNLDINVIVGSFVQKSRKRTENCIRVVFWAAVFESGIADHHWVLVCYVMGSVVFGYHFFEVVTYSPISIELLSRHD